MKYLKQYGNDRTKYPAVIGYNRLLSDDESTHKFLKDVGIGQNETNYEQIIRFTQRFLRDLHHVDKDAYRTLFDVVNRNNAHETQKEEMDEPNNEIHKQICQRIKDIWDK